MPAELSVKEVEHSQAVKAMFSGIAPRYDLLNHVLSLNIDKRWRRRVKQPAYKPFSLTRMPVVLDVACGTGDLSAELQRELQCNGGRHRFLPSDARHRGR